MDLLEMAGAIRKSVIWGLGALMLLTIHPSSLKAQVVITVIACVFGAFN